ncbi:MAG: translation initiation factor IF-3 [Acidobacteria bacterium]|jgi:translation initiation factor IF-3|nr:translation initiation factor IF-3 [Acidobacteriota bacterium]
MRFSKPIPNKKKNPHRINEEILAREVRLIDEEKNQIGILSIAQAMDIAREKELDLVEISPEAQPPVCRVLDYGKFLYALQKKAHEAQRHQRKILIKEIKFTPVIGEHDVEVKLRKIKEFLAEGNKVKVTVWLKGRQKRKPEMLETMVARIMEILKEIAEIEAPPKREGFFCHIMIGAKKGGKDAKAKDA